MVKGLLIIIGSCLCLIFGLETNLLYAASQGNPAAMQEHIEKVKRRNPSGYQEMVDKAGGVITNCLSCHIDIKKKKNVPGQTNPR
jgi:hypothetical protein